MMSCLHKEGGARPLLSSATPLPRAKGIKPTRVACLLACTIALAGCGSLGAALSGAPDVAMLNRLPVVDYGSAAPAGPYVLRFKAGQPIASLVQIQGNALVADQSATLNPALQRDLYVHQRWVSFDGSTWHRQQDALAFHLQLHLPSDQNPKAPQLLLKIQRTQGAGV